MPVTNLVENPLVPLAYRGVFITELISFVYPYFIVYEIACGKTQILEIP